MTEYSSDDDGADSKSRLVAGSKRKKLSLSELRAETAALPSKKSTKKKAKNSAVANDENSPQPPVMTDASVDTWPTLTSVTETANPSSNTRQAKASRPSHAQSTPSPVADAIETGESKPTRQGQPQKFDKFVKSREKRPKKRSRQKNIRKDTRPDHLKPSYLTVVDKATAGDQTKA